MRSCTLRAWYGTPVAVPGVAAVELRRSAAAWPSIRVPPLLPTVGGLARAGLLLLLLLLALLLVPSEFRVRPSDVARRESRPLWLCLWL